MKVENLVIYPNGNYCHLFNNIHADYPLSVSLDHNMQIIVVTFRYNKILQDR